MTNLIDQETAKMRDLVMDLRGLAGDQDKHGELAETMWEAAKAIESMRAMIFKMSGLADFWPDEMPNFTKDDILDLKYAAEELRRTGHNAVPDGLLNIGGRIAIALRKSSRPEKVQEGQRAQFDTIFDFGEFQWNARKFGTEEAVFQFWQKTTNQGDGK